MQQGTLYLVRHGETEYNRLQIVQGRGIDAALNETGRSQAAAVARRLADVQLNAIYASTLRRAVETAEQIATEHRGLTVQRLDDLSEMAWGVYEGRPHSPQLKQDFEAFRERWRNGDFAFRIEGGESILDVQRRGRRAIESILKRHPGEAVLVVTHGRFLRVLLATLLEDYGLKRMEDIAHANTGLNTIHYREGRFEAHLLNCTAHLETHTSSAVG